MGDFNMNLLNNNTNKTVTQFVDELYTNFFIPYINLPPRTTSHSETLTDNIFSKIK